LSVNPSAVDVAVIGGGAIGLSVAWRAAQRGLDVVVLDAGSPRDPASAVAAGMLAPAAEVEFGDAGRDLLTLGLESARRWPAFAAELEASSGIAPALRRSGTLMLARDRDEAEELERELELRERLGLGVVRLRASEARALEPALGSRVRLALEARDDHSVDPRAMVAALTVAAARAGVAVRVATPVARLLCDPPGERVTGVELEDGTCLRAHAVVVAAGAWSGELRGLEPRARVPVRPVKGQILRLRDPRGAGLVERVLRFAAGYLVPRADGGYVLGATVEERGFDTSVTVGGVEDLLRRAIELVPGLEELEIEETGAGLRPGTPDNLPILGPGAVAGLTWATGHHRNGILLAPITGELVAGGLAGDPPGELLSACRADRFREAAPAIERIEPGVPA
jgi:glycine oxidase